MGHRHAEKHGATPAASPAESHLYWAGFSGSPTPAWQQMRAMAELAMAALAPREHSPPANAYKEPTNSWSLTSTSPHGQGMSTSEGNETYARVRGTCKVQEHWRVDEGRVREEQGLCLCKPVDELEVRRSGKGWDAVGCECARGAAADWRIALAAILQLGCTPAHLLLS